MKKLIMVLGISTLFLAGNVNAGVKEVLLQRLVNQTAFLLVCEDLANSNNNYELADRVRAKVNGLWKGLGQPTSRTQYDIDQAYQKASNFNMYYLEDQCGRY